jgi:hypothetical protein
MRNVIGMLIGAAIDRRDGDSGIKGAIAGLIAQSAIRVVLPVAATYAVGWGVLHLAGKALSALPGGKGNSEPIAPESADA